VIGRLRQSPWRVLAALLLVAAVACGIAAAISWSSPTDIEGVYLNRSIGQPAYSGVYSGSGVADGRVWLGVAIGLAIASLLVAALSVWESRRRAQKDPPRQAPSA
jgi:ABC-type nitrate/sulfonate/bicarbonate transport system permease component